MVENKNGLAGLHNAERYKMAREILELKAELEQARLELKQSEDDYLELAIYASARNEDLEKAYVQHWTPDQVSMLFDRQYRGEFHPYTCPRRDDGAHALSFVDKGALVPTVDGWICPFCDYTQGWASEIRQ